ncbi:TPA_asm: N [Howea betacytorhabdovirus 1]|nr:TPA_asm: N [Howea betacytorhabdovirus 1]
MAQRHAAASDAILNLYKDVGNNLSAPGLTEINYNDQALVKDHVFYNLVALDITQLQLASASFIEGLRNPQVNDQFLTTTLLLGINLLQPSSSETQLHRVHDIAILEWNTKMLKTSENPQNVALSVPAPEPTNQTKKNEKPAEAQTAEVNIDDLLPPDMREHPVAQDQNVKIEQDAAANLRVIKEATFCAAFILRMITKQAAPTNLAWGATMVARFKKWYGKAMNIANPGEAQLSAIKDRIDESQILKNTWAVLVMLSDYLTRNDPTSNSINKYIGVTPIGYGSMQIQNMFMQCWHKTKISPKDILINMHCPQTKSATRVIAELCAKYEPKTNDLPKPNLFRVARIVNPQYFAGIQIKENPLALAVLVYLLMKVSAFGTNSDPGRMFAMESLSADMKRAASGIADRIFAMQGDGDDSDYSAIARAAFQNTRPQVGEEVPEVNLENLLN